MPSLAAAVLAHTPAGVLAPLLVAASVSTVGRRGLSRGGWRPGRGLQLVELLCVGGEFVAEVGMGDGDQPLGALAEALAE